MATKNVTVDSVGYTGVAKVDLPITGSQNEARFVDTSDGDALPVDVTAGKVFYNLEGRQVGTNSGSSGGVQSGTFSPESDITTKQITVDGTLTNLVLVSLSRPNQSDYRLQSVVKLASGTAYGVRSRYQSSYSVSFIDPTVTFASNKITVTVASTNPFMSGLTYYWLAW